MKMRLKYLMLILSVLSFNGCDLFEGENQIVTKEALLIWSGDYAADGCGFSLEFDNKKLHGVEKVNGERWSLSIRKVFV